MLKSLVLGAILGGIAAFVWSLISWSMLPWHERALHSFENEDEVSAVITSHAPLSGNYLLPTGPSQQWLRGEERKAAEEIRMQKMAKGPLMFAAIRKEGFGSFPKVLLTQLLGQMFAALLLTWMLLQTSGLSYAGRVTFLAVAGLAVAFAVALECSLVEWCLILLCIGGVITAELFNSALETLFHGLDEATRSR